MAKNTAGGQITRSIAHRLILVTVLFSIMITVLTTGGLLFKDYQNDVDDIHTRIDQIRSSHLESLVSSIWSFDKNLTQIQLDGLLRWPDFEYLSIHKGEQVIWQAGEAVSKNTLSVEIPLIHQSQGEKIGLGTLRVVASLDAIYGRLFEKGVSILLSVGVLISIVTGLLFFTVQRLITRHLTSLAGYARSVKFDDLTRPFLFERDHKDSDQSDELDVIAHAVNDMRTNLKTAFDDLVKYKEQLEQRVWQSMQAEKALRENEARYKEASHIAHLGHWIYDLVADKLVHCSDELARIHGVSPDAYVEMISSTKKDIESVHPEDQETYAKATRDALKDGKSFDVEYRIIRPDGVVRHLREIGEPIFDDTGVLIQERGTIQDISDRKMLEDQLRQSQRMEAVGQLTGGVAHDFNNLLAIMLGNAELLEDLAGEDKEARKNIEAIKAAVGRASSLTGRLLTFSRQSTLAPIAADICDLIGGLNDMLQRALGETVELRAEDTVGLWPAMIDTHQFENALVNLALNARDAMPQGGILTIETANVSLDETYAQQYDEVAPGDYVKVSVTDTGTGIPPDALAKVFEPFFTTKEVGKGSGLGLSMVFGFVKQSSGHITIYSEVGHGTSVKLYMPRSQDGQTEIDVKKDVIVHAQGSERILVVEDDPDVRKIPAAILRDQGYEVVEAGNGEDATKRLQDGPPFDLLFTDIVLPGGMNGVEIAEQAQKLQATIKILYATGYAENASVQVSKMVASGMLVNKPYLRAELLEKVRYVLDRESN